MNFQGNTQAKILTYDGQLGGGPDGAVEPRRSHLALVVGVVRDRGIRDAQIVHSLLPVAEHRVARIPGYHRREAQGEAILGPLDCAGHIGHLAAHHGLGSFQDLQVVRRGPELLLLGVAGRGTGHQNDDN